MRVRVFALLVGLTVPIVSPSEGEEDDACALLTREEIAAVQGEGVTATKSSHPARKGFVVSQCFFTAATFEKSVSLQATRRDSRSPAGKEPADDWKRLFHPLPAKKGAPTERQNGKPTEGEKEPPEPLRLEGLGDEAFWVGNRFVGALYVLKGGSYFRISVGGWTDESVRMEKSKALAQRVLKRL